MLLFLGLESYFCDSDGTLSDTDCTPTGIKSVCTLMLFPQNCVPTSFIVGFSMLVLISYTIATLCGLDTGAFSTVSCGDGIDFGFGGLGFGELLRRIGSGGGAVDFGFSGLLGIGGGGSVVEGGGGNTFSS